MLFQRNKETLIQAQDALPGRDEEMPISDHHAVLDAPLKEPEPGYFASQGLQQAMFGLGCFWGAERRFWQLPGIYTTAVGYAGGFTRNPTYQEVCSGRTAHAEVVWLVFDPVQLSYQELLTTFWESHDPTQGMRQGNDRGSQYRSIILTYTTQQEEAASKARAHYQDRLKAEGFADITTEIVPAGKFYYAEDYHQQYLAKNPMGYCGLGGTGVCYA